MRVALSFFGLDRFAILLLSMASLVLAHLFVILSEEPRLRDRLAGASRSIPILSPVGLPRCLVQRGGD
jgi:hypothetical protein